MNQYTDEKGHLNELGFSYLTETQEPALLEHLHTCDECLETYRLLNDFLEEHNYIPKKNYPVYLNYVAAVLLLIGGFFLIPSNSPFDRNPSLELLVGDQTRSELLHITSPKIDDVFHINDSISFSGSLFTGATVQIYTNEGKVVFKGEVKHTMLRVNLPFTPGRYYWKLVYHDDIRYVGTFVVKDFP